MIYIVMENTYYEGSDLLEVFDSLEKAKKFVEDKVKNRYPKVKIDQYETYLNFNCGWFGYSIHHKEIL